MTKGRKKLPDNVKSLRGTDQPCRMDGPAPALVPAAGGGGAELTLPKTALKGTAKKLYTVLGTEMLCNGLLDAASLDLLVAYCREMALYNDMMKDLEREGVTIEVETKGGGVVTQINPKRKIAEGALSNAQRLASEFGLSPASRGRVAAVLAGNAPKDAFAEFEIIELQ